MSELQAKITESELRAMLLDPRVPEKDIAPYLMTSPTEGTSFAPVVVPNPTLVTPSIEEGAVLMSSVNGISKWRRAQAYKRKIKTWTGPRLVSEGDSWFQYPLLLEDVVDQLDAHYAIRSLGAAGDLVADIVKQDELITTIAVEKPDAVILSGGGNDLLGEGRLERVLRRFDPTFAPKDYLSGDFDISLNQIIGLYTGVLRRVVRTFPGLPVFIHGYDHAIPDNGRWLGRPMRKLGIVDKTLQAQIVAEIVNRYYAALEVVVASQTLRGQIQLVDCRGIVRGAWHDELHPKNSGYKRVADAFHEKIKITLATEGLETLELAPANGLAVAAQAALNLSQTTETSGLLAELGRRTMLTSTDLDYVVPVGAEFSATALEGVGDTLHTLGKRIFTRLNRELNTLLCGDGEDAQGDRKKLADAIGIGDAAVAAVIVEILVGTFAVIPAVAAVVAALILKYILKPTLDEVCTVWTENL
ncbi:MAG: SGNH/GDSL hydrolase family protein [Sulfitobacter sp.]